MFDIGFPRDWSSLKKLIWLKAAISGGGASAVWKTVTGALIHITDALASPVQALSVAIEPQQGDGKNKLPNLQTTQTISGVTFTVYDDGSVNVNGTATDSFAFSLNTILEKYLSNGVGYILSGSPTNQDTSKWKFRVFNANMDYIDTGNGVTFTFVSSAKDKKCDIVVYSGTTMNNVLIKPMIRLSSISDATFSPYSNPTTNVSDCNVYVRNANLLDYSEETVNYRLDNVGKLTSNSNYATSEFISVKPGKWYYFRSLITSSVGYAIAEYTDKDPNTFIRVQQVGTGSSPKSAARQTSVTTNYIRVSYWKDHRSDPAVLYPSENTDYVPYSGTTYPISWQTEAGSITSGTLTISENGSVTLESGGNTFNLTSITPIETLVGENNIWADVNGEITLIYKAVPETAFSDNADTGMADYMTLTE